MLAGMDPRHARPGAGPASLIAHLGPRPLLLMLLLAACATPSTSEPQASVVDATDGETGFPPACDMLSAGELVTIVGNDLADGVSNTTMICDWESEAEATSVALLLQPVPTDICVSALEPGEATERFGAPGAIHYDDLGGIPGAQATACLDQGMVVVTITGGYGADSDPDRYSGEAIEVMQLVLGRL